MIDAPLIISLLVFSAIMLFFLAFVVYLGYVRGHQTIVEKIKQSDPVAMLEEERFRSAR